ncbi:MAG: HAD family phosphatase [Deltaproteobacteria bacterium]|nr:HAD family phosphatase [Deltaproteobacteria bacterium]
MEPFKIKAVLFDFGGVLADEGFRKGLVHIAQVNGLDPDEFFEVTRELIYSTGYINGLCPEALFWDRLRMSTGIRGTDEGFREIILERFLIRDWMMDLVRRLKQNSLRVAILSDQTNWLDELDQRLCFSGLFEQVFNSYHLGKSKADPSLFATVLSLMGLKPGEALFVDDTPGNIERAQGAGLATILFSGRQQFLCELERFCPGVAL